MPLVTDSNTRVSVYLSCGMQFRVPARQYNKNNFVFKKRLNSVHSDNYLDVHTSSETHDEGDYGLD
jgi:hypothetical protein